MDPPVFKSDKEMRAERAMADAAASGLTLLKPEHEVATKVMDLPGYVRTPYTHPHRLVDVRGLLPGTLVVCPFTGKFFNLPADFVDAGPHAGHPLPPKQQFERVPTSRRSTPRTSPRPPAVRLPATSATLPKPPVAAAATAAVTKSPALPYGRAVPGRPGFVTSPYAANHQLVDVTGLAAGMQVKCPYTGKFFRVPEK